MDGIELFGVLIPWPVLIVAAVIIIALIALIISSLKKTEEEKEVPDMDTRENFGDFSGLLTKEDFEVPCEDRMLEMYRTQWIKAEPGDKKDNFLLLYLALKQFNAEQDAASEEWSQEQCESRMDEIIAELTEKTGLKLIVDEIPEEDFEEYFGEDDYDEADETIEEEEEEIEE